MIVRVWHGWTTRDNAEPYQELLRGEILPAIAARGVAGYRGAQVLRRPVPEGVEFVTLLRFADLDAVRAFAGDDYEAAFVPPKARALLVRFDLRAIHFEEVEGAA
jgi:antibiotic biosynthesis monooxygenase (ABM) superfamily enzyme